jgi:phosphomannomutase
MKVSISGIRGIYGHDLNLHEISKFTRLFASSSSIIKKLSGNGGRRRRRRCVLARDTRPSGRIIAQTVSANLMAQGIDVYNLGVAPTPMVFREARKYEAGFIVTASHNPPEWNGLKFIVEGRGIFEDELALMLKGTTPRISNHEFGKSYDIVSDYVNEVVDLVSSGEEKKELSSDAVKVGFDPAGGATCGYSDQLFKKLGHKSYSTNDVRGIFSRGPDPTVDDLHELRMLVIANQLDFGFAFDLDGDRLVVVNNRGEKLSPDTTLLICVASAISLLQMKKFVTSIDTSLSVEKFVIQHGGKLHYSKVGEANVVNKMLQVDADAGGEGSSAGFIMPKFNKCRDGFLASAIISSLDRKIIDECLTFASQYIQIRSKVPADSLLHSKVIEKLNDLFVRESSQVLTIDGLKAIIDDDSWILVRPSNTEHAIRISVESTKDRAQSLYKEMSKKVQLAYDQVK